MGSSNSRAVRGEESRQTRPQISRERCRRRTFRRFRPFIRSFSCGTVFPRSHENDDLPSEIDSNLPVCTEEDTCASEVSSGTKCHSCPVASEHVCNSSIPSTSGESSSSTPRNDLMQILETERNLRVMPASALLSTDNYPLEHSSGQNNNSVPNINTSKCKSTILRSETSTDPSNDIRVQHSTPSVQSRHAISGEGSSQLDFNKDSENACQDAQGVLESNPAEESLLPEGSAAADVLSNSESVEAETRDTRHEDAASALPEESPGMHEGYVSSQEARRNSRRRVWDALTRGGAHRRRAFAPAILLSADIDDFGSSDDRWFLDLSGFLYEDGFEDDRPFSGPNYDLEERRGRLRSQVWALQRLRRSSDGGRTHSRYCSFHRGGQCSCEAHVMTEESSTHASISRIVMLAEALFESVALSQSSSSSLVSLPAPESVVDSFPIRRHKVPEGHGSTVDEKMQCYICLSDYEEGDKIRTLPCRHEYHMACVDKWLKEIHRVCPLCRGNVCENQGSVSAASSSRS
eukprot:TRINITY_DN5068_c0_g2_i1.p1 TRINITY_DN5068_c0_g2~~TRINITY_DN5068_c0_g2_i1.p1  ORF type:complete len:519 (+),score=68.77 TRINITY_DN5068_c0_g2_i1:370-1926(+)